MALVIAGERSGAGKTTVTIALLACLKRRGISVQSFKVGPDYIDPMFHQYVTGYPCRNLDVILTSENYVQECFKTHTQKVKYALVEGVMGLFDGVSGNGLENKYSCAVSSTAHIARLLDLPVILTIDCRSLSGSVAAIAHGYRSFDSNLKLAGVILNKVGSDRHLELLKDALAPLQLPILGVLRRDDDITIPDRHLGLVPVAEMSNLDTILDKIAHLADKCFDWEGLLPLLNTKNHNINSQGITFTTKNITNKIRIAIAKDKAFNFYYQDNLDLLEKLGAELIFWSPLKDAALPEGIQGLYFGGGFPEVFAAELSSNRSACAAVKAAITAGIPTLAECGGLMYLCQEIVNFDNEAWQMVDILPTTAIMGSRLSLGYRQAIALQNTPLLPAGTKVYGHEFHRSHLTKNAAKPILQTRGYSQDSLTNYEGWGLHQIHASYIHLHWGGRGDLPTRFLQHCAANNFNF